MATCLIGRIALVTGASSGIGFSVTKKLAQLGMKVAACSRNIDKIITLAEECQQMNIHGVIYPIRCDVSKEDQVIAMFAEIYEKFGGIDVCINNAGLAHHHVASLLNGDVDSWRNMLDVNILGLCICTREAIKLMRARNVKNGHIIHINGMSGHRVVASPHTHFYAATKFAVTALTEGLRNELREIKSDIRISSISPGMVKTEFAYRAGGKERGDAVYNRIDKNLEPQDVADAIIFALQAPPHVQIHDIQMRPIEQKN